jgi:hypothetical protein
MNALTAVNVAFAEAKWTFLGDVLKREIVTGDSCITADSRLDAFFRQLLLRKRSTGTD